MCIAPTKEVEVGWLQIDGNFHVGDRAIIEVEGCTAKVEFVHAGQNTYRTRVVMWG